MIISDAEWVNFITKLKALDDMAAEEIKQYAISSGAFDEATQTYTVTEDLIQYAYAIATKYGEASAALSALLYDEEAALEGVSLPPAEVAPTASYRDVIQAIYGSHDFSPTLVVLGAAISRLVKLAGVDTTVKNAIRDRAQIAFVPHGDTCAYCIMLASSGWRTASDADLKDGHVAHCHGNCDCTYAVRHKKESFVKSYDPEKYAKIYRNADGDTEEERLNSMRRDFYAENKEKIADQKAAAYEKRKLRESPEAEEMDV